MQTVSRPPTSASSPSCERGASYEYTRLLKHCDNICMVANHRCYHIHYKRNDNRVAGSSRSLGFTHIGSIVVPFSGVPYYRIRIMNPKKELLWGLWVGETQSEVLGIPVLFGRTAGTCKNGLGPSITQP